MEEMEGYEEADDEEAEDEEADDKPWTPSSFEEMKSKMPAYFFMSFKQKRKYFSKLTMKYMNACAQGVKPGKRRLKFDMGEISVKSNYFIFRI
jgi:hypothetical protein